MKKILLITLNILFAFPLFAQNSISGTIIDKETEEPLAFVNIYLPDLKKGTVSREDGNFQLNDIPEGNINIQFSYIGYRTQILTVDPSDGETKLDIKLEATVIQSDEVVISGGQYSTQDHNAVKIETISAKMLNNSGSPSLMKSLSNIPGIDMISKGVGVSKPVIRGLSMTNILMLNNGVRLENFQFSENHPYLVDEFGVDKIEVIKGPASLLYGSDAIGGAINFIAEKPAPVGKILGDYTIQYHSNTAGIVSNLGLKGAENNFFWGIRAGLKSHKDFKQGEGMDVPNTRFNETSVKLNTGINKAFGTFQLSYKLNLMQLGMVVPASIPLIKNNSRQNEVWYQDLDNHLISSKNTLFIKNIKTEINLAYQFNNRRLQTSVLEHDLTEVDMDLQTFSYELKTFFEGGKHFSFIAGMQGMNKDNFNHDAPEHVLPDFSSNDLSGFGMIQFHYKPKIHAQAGLRFDYRNIWVPEQIHEDPEHGEETIEEIKKDYGNLSFSIGGTYHASETVLLRANFASGYRTPNIAELTQDGGHGARYEQGNPNLKSQRSYEGDVSIHLHTKNATFDFAAFYNNINNYIFLAPTNEVSEDDELIYRYTQNNASIKGLETGLKVYPYPFLFFKTTYTYLLGKQENDDYLPFIPQNKLKIEIGIEKENFAFFNKPFFHISSEYADMQKHPAPFETKTPDYLILNAKLGFNVELSSQTLEFGIFANNLLDEKYVDHLSTLKPLGFYNIGRNIGLSLKVPFGLKGG